MADTITVFLADDSVLIREGVGAMLRREHDLDIVGVAEDHDGLIGGAIRSTPNVVVSDIRMPPNFQTEGIDACKEIRKRLPGTGIVILSQYDDPDYAISLLADGAAGFASPKGTSWRGRYARSRPVVRCSTPASSLRLSTRSDPTVT